MGAGVQVVVASQPVLPPPRVMDSASPTSSLLLTTVSPAEASSVRLVLRFCCRGDLDRCRVLLHWLRDRMPDVSATEDDSPPGEGSQLGTEFGPFVPVLLVHVKGEAPRVLHHTPVRVSGGGRCTQC